MTKQRLMLSAAMAALLTGWVQGARADTDITQDHKSAVETSTGGDITIEEGGQIEIKASNPAVTINSNNSVTNEGSISNTDTSGATGVAIDTTNGNIVSATGLSSIGSINLGGDGTTKAGISVIGGHTFFGNISLSEINETLGESGSVSTATVQASSIYVQGDDSAAMFLQQGTTIDGDVGFGGSIQMVRSDGSSATGATLFDLEGNINGNLVFDQYTTATNVGTLARGIAILGPINSCASDQSARDAAGAAACASNSTGAFVNSGSFSVVGILYPNYRGGNPEGGSVVVIANSIAGGFLNNGPATANDTQPTAILSGNGAVSQGIAYPTLVIDPSQSITATNTTVRGPVIIGPIASSIDSVDPGYSVINRGTISATPTDQDISSSDVVIQGSSPTNYTCLGNYTASVAAGSCVTTVTNSDGSTSVVGGLLNTGTISATSTTSVNTNSATSATAVTIGSYTTIPRIVVSGEATSSSTYTPGTISATVSGPGGGSATALDILNLADVPEVDVLQHGSITAEISTTTVSPTADFATQKSPFEQVTEALVDASGTVKTINNAGSIIALNTVQTAASNAYVVNTAHAIDLLAGTSGHTTINNSGSIEGDVYFNSGGNGNTFNVGNTGTGCNVTSTSFSCDGSGNANAAITAAQGAAVTNTPYNYATVSLYPTATVSGLPPTTEANVISFGPGTGNVLHVGGFGYVDSVILDSPGGLDVQVDNNGLLYIANTEATGSVYANHFDVNDGGTLGLTISQDTSATQPVVLASTEATLGANSKLGIQFGSFIASSNPEAPTKQVITLISAPNGQLVDSGLNYQNSNLSQNIPFLFESQTDPTESNPVENAAENIVPTPLATGTDPTTGNSVLTLTLIPRSVNAYNADGTPGLNLQGDARKLYPYTAAALANDPTLGAAIATNLTVYNSNQGSASGINYAASQQKAQQIFSQFAPDVSGGARQVAIAITDEATGPVAARQRFLRQYGDQEGEMTLWGQEFAGLINNKGRFDGEGDLTQYKDHGFGFSLGVDGGSARGGWYGGALTFYSSDVIETLPRNSKTNMQWYLLSGYTEWHGKHVFLDTKLDIGYGGFTGYRDMDIGDQIRQAVGKRAGELASIGANTGVIFNWGNTQLVPHVSLDGLTMREEGYTESGGGDGLDLQVAPYYADSLRTAFGVDLKQDVEVWGATVSPQLRAAYRYDFVGTPVKLRAAFASTGGLNAPGNAFTFVGPDPDTGNVVLGASLGAGTDTWHLGFSFDWVRGNNNSTTQMGTISLLGRI